MELAVKILEGLQILGDMTLIPDDTFYKTISLFLKSAVLGSNDTRVQDDVDLSKLKQGALKQAQAAFLTFVFEATKCDADTASMGHILEDCKIPSDRIDKITQLYEQHKAELQILLSNTSHNPPHVVDVNWSLQHSLKNNFMERVNQPEYLIKLKTEQVGQPDSDGVQFSCTQEQLQDLVGKLKDACKSLERTAQQQ